MLGGGESRDLHLSENADVIDMEKINPDAVDLPGWYRPNPGFARDLAFVAFSTVGGELVAKQITNYRWALSAFGTASAATRPRRHRLLPDAAASPVRAAGGARRRGRRRGAHRAVAWPAAGPLRAGDPPVRRHRGELHLGDAPRRRRRPRLRADRHHPVRLFIGSGMPTGLWQRVTDVFAPAQVVEFFATTDGQAVLANVSGAKIGSKGRPLPGGGQVELAAYDVDSDLILEDDRGFVQIADTDQVGVLLARPRGPVDPTASVKRGVFAPADTWVSTESLFRRDADGDYWLVGSRSAVIHTARGVVYAARHRRGRPDRRGRSRRHLRGGREGHQVAITAIALRPGTSIPSADLTEAVPSARRQPPRHRPRGAGDEAQRVLPPADQPASGRGPPQAVA